jgi:hypothetical protein
MARYPNIPLKRKNQMADALAGYDQAAVMEGEGRYAMDSKLFVEFFRRPVLNSGKSAEAGRPVFDEYDFVRIIIPGDRNSTMEAKVTEEHRRRFASRWQRYIAGQDQAQSGTPIEQWPIMTVSQVANLKAINIHTIEQLAGLSDQNATQLMGNFELRKKAQAFLDLAKDNLANEKLEASLKQRDEEINLLKEQMAQLLAATTKPTPAKAAAKEA